MKPLFFAVLVLGLAGCGGGSQSITNPGNQKVIDPSGNWTMTATDQQGKNIALAALFNQVGSVVTANSFTAAGNPAPFNCVPFTASFSNGLVQNVSTFSADVTLTFARNFPSDMTQTSATFHFTSTLNDPGTSFSGTYSGMPACAGIAATGTFTGAEVPTVTGSWTGTLQQCNFDQQIGKCTSNVGSPSAIAFNLTQNDATGNVTGTYQVANMAGFSNGSVSVIPPSDILSGLVLQFSMTDANGSNFATNGLLGMNKTFAAVLFGKAGAGTGNNAYALTISH